MTDTAFIALYRGRTVGNARLLAVSSEPEIVRRFIRELAGETGEQEAQDEPAERKPLCVVRGDEE